MRFSDSTTSTTPSGRAAAWVSATTVALVCVLAAWIAAMIYSRVIVADLPVSWDEGAHSLFALAIANDVRTGDFVGAAYDTYRQVYWPPLHSWIAGVAILAFGEHIEVVRSVSLVAYVLAPLVLLAAGRVMHARDDMVSGWIAAAIAGVLTIAIPALIPFASIALLDLPALVAVMLTLLAAFFAERSPERPARRVLIAAGILAAFFLKTNYGILLMLVFAIDASIDARFSPRALLSRRNVYLAVPVIIVLATWFAYPPKIASTIRALMNKPAGASAWTVEGFLFYPRTLLTFAGSPVLLITMVAAVMAAWPRRREPNVRLLLLLAGVQLVLGQLHHTKEDRHILPIVPALVLVTAAAGAQLAIAIRAMQRGPRRSSALASGGVVLVTMAVQLVALGRQPLPSWRRTPTPELGDAYHLLVARIDSAVMKGHRVLVVGTFDLSPGAPVIDWDLAANRRLLAVEHSGAIGELDTDRAVAAALRRSPLPAWLQRPIVRVLERSDSPGRVRTMYAGLPSHLDSRSFATSFHAALPANASDVVLIATSVSQSARYRPSYFAPALAGVPLELVSSHTATTGRGMRIDEYRASASVR